MSNPETPQASTHNLNVASFRSLITPRELKAELPLTARSQASVTSGRSIVRAILDGHDSRFLAIVGPCSIHDVGAAREYAQRLATLAADLASRVAVVMRTYFEKPRTTVGWKGLINDPHLDDSFDMEHGLRLARRLLLDINELGLPAATEMLDPITPQYIDDLVSWAAIGARTIESQTHRQMASGLSMPVGYKNTTEGRIEPRSTRFGPRSNPIAFWESTRTVGHPSSRRAAIHRATCSCAADASGRITIGGSSPRPLPNSKPRACRPDSWSTAATPTRASATSVSRSCGPASSNSARREMRP
jgi:3-deoxy-7-phosphoheptulonate synthase